MAWLYLRLGAGKRCFPRGAYFKVKVWPARNRAIDNIQERFYHHATRPDYRQP